MPTPSNSILGRLSAALGLSSWLLSLVFLALFGTALRALTADIPIHSHTFNATDSTRQLGMSVQLMNHALEGWAVGIAAFGVLAVCAILALLGVESGRRALKSGASTGSAAAGTTAGGLYLCCLAGLFGLALAAS